MGADRSEGLRWLGDVLPEIDRLVDAAQEVMTLSPLSTDDIRDVRAVWRITAETEDMIDFVKARPAECLHALMTLADCDDPDVRWQIYDSIPYCVEHAGRFLRECLKDEDAYCRRRALKGLSRLRPSDAADLIEQCIVSDDEYMRLVCLEMAFSTSEQLYEDVRARLANDPCPFVRERIAQIDNGV